MKPVPVAELVDGVRAGSRQHVARAITLLESRRPDHRAGARELLAALEDRTGGAVRVGISGVPGVGKSTFIDALGMRLVDQGHRVAVVAVDPSSRRTGGSILGDRTRMGRLAASEDAFVRPSPAGRHLGGVARATRESMLVLEAAGFDVVVVETVGVGQNEVAVSEMVDTFLLLTLARSGDQLQGIKRGILELADVIAVNKADGDGTVPAQAAAKELAGALRLMMPGREVRRPPVLTCSAVTGTGLDEVWQAVLDHRAYLEEHHSLDARRAEQQQDWMWALVDAELTDGVRASRSVRAERESIEHDVRCGELSAVEGAARVLALYTMDLRGAGTDTADAATSAERLTP
ncbi:methylmalonyl Co-A mutase-associated GTPase MeaB [Phycicoccus endophyticus]|uniref:Methylmalonyl Co-A mutase-associated GTPase MeaB n=1 Tax=Phycicoccus endophyticus TaxID=1690220 RepID=A0A7G9QZ55_9MICO|nr:methylmalonyl Co-A mutase-associated GTPase MeaB [Phycicoccus endophyticus]NHI18976.1 methylmalonyl Co-A mutase-associated GTPase MeaB [Phycicoccus endophyticus]QNN48630.1 methylmalonyl Co-A mutase-associated GTPase MeaB [Phycicoccus endophyticus]GGL31794.1 ATPase/protein kinase [Phycicoccus endophyticus]